MIKINFVDFWGGFKADDNYFYHALCKKVDVKISNNPDILFFSVFGNDHYKYSCKKIFFTGETRGVSSNEYNLKFSFDETCNKNYKLPLWVLYIDWFNSHYPNSCNPSYLLDINTLFGREILAKDKTKFCNFIYNNPAPERLLALDFINTYKNVDCAGSLRNNIGKIIYGDEKIKLDYMKDFKFSIAFENTKYDGYVTEKILHAFSSGTIPIYWGSDDVVKYFNKDSFINCNNMSHEEMLETIKEIDKNDDLFYKYLSNPVFKDNKFPIEFCYEAVAGRILQVV